MHVLTAVADNDAIDDVRMVPRLRQVVRQLNAFIGPLKDVRRATRAIRTPRAFHDQFTKQHRFS